jgi:hypothetical protein
VNNEGINMLTNKKTIKNDDNDEESEFLIREIEVWGVKFKDWADYLQLIYSYKLSSIIIYN